VVYLVPLAAADTTPQGGAAPRSAAADSAQFQSAFRQAAWLWTRLGERDGVDTVSVRYVTPFPASRDPLRVLEYAFYPAQLRAPNTPPQLSR
jgi:hypothetical protein